MIPIKKALNSTIGKKYLMAASGILLLGFLVNHLLANFLLYFKDPGPFNGYVHKLYSFGDLLYVAEAGLLGLFLLHIVVAFCVTGKNKSARPEKYEVTRSKGGPSQSSLASRNMIVTGVILLLFLIVHVWKFRFGPGIDEGYTTVINGETSRDLYRLVIETFQNPWWVLGYVSVMVFLGFHLRHGFWSAFQSLGVSSDRMAQCMQCLGWLVAAIFTLGFIGIPIVIFLRGA